MSNKPDQIYTVSAVNRMAKYAIEESFPSVWVEGEITNYHLHGSGHRYFSIRDDQCQLRCAMWRSKGGALKFEPKDGLKVLIQGALTIYDRNGSFQMSVNRMLPSGTGALELAFQQLKEKLSKEGLFDPEHKKELPSHPMRIGVVTSPTGAVIHDIVRVIKRRNRKISIVLWPSEVQGDSAPSGLAEGIKRFNEYGQVDLIIIGRGGGSLEDLWGFNSEEVVRAVYESDIPVVSAVGHEVDLTLTDLVADYSAATPSMAAEIVAWLLADFNDNLNSMINRMGRSVTDSIKDGRDVLGSLLSTRAMSRPETILEGRYQYLDQQVRLLRLLSEKRYDTFCKGLAGSASRLEALSPLGVLARGYSVTRQPDTGRVIASVETVSVGDRIETILPDGSIYSDVQEKKPRK